MSPDPNEPSNVLSCEGLTQQALTLARHFDARTYVISGQDLLEKNFNLIHAVGRASEEEPRLVDMRWGEKDNPAVTLVGKGVVFDTGGINNKDTWGMRDMKYDMAGAAHALGVAAMVMDANLPVNLRVLLPIVENANGPKGYKQGNVFKTRMGQTIEITDTDAEGRMIMLDALHEAANPVQRGVRRPNLIMSYGTMGWFGVEQMPGFGTVVSNKTPVQNEFLEIAAACREYFTPRPLLKPLQRELRYAPSPADIIQCRDHGRYDDLLVAALLHMAVGDKSDWLYNDLQPWRESNANLTQYPAGLSSGAFANGVRTSFRLIQQRYG